MSADHDKLEPRTLIAGRYRVYKTLGRGGAGTVHEAIDERTERRLALKLLQRRRGGPGSVSAALFEREYHTLCQLAHPRIIEVYDYGVDDGRAFYTMELLDGQDLQSMAVLPWARAAELLCDVASSLAIVHARGFVHRDVSARNVRCTAVGQAKLFDFGAMSPMGAAPRTVVGTPPYVPPEALEMQGLDGRADLYALGALAYLLLTGYHAYESRTLAGLRSIWRSPPMPPSQYDSRIPAALDRLVMELLQLERTARPTSAAEVMERLSGIAGLPLIELPQVKRSYLVMPTLVGREAEITEARTSISAMTSDGRGGAISLEGEAGVGRSRCLDACVLEGRLLGALVLRGDAADSADRGDYGLLRGLCEQLFLAEPDGFDRIGRRHAASLAFLLPAFAQRADTSPPLDSASIDGPQELVPQGAPTSTLVPPERRAILIAVQELLLDAARARPILIAVDDCHAVDEPSVALLGLLARVTKQRPILLLTTSESAAKGSDALRVLREASTRRTLPSLEVDQTEALLRSVFGDVAYIAPLAHTIFSVAGGNPKATMALAEYLIERDLARYEAGSWSLPSELDPNSLPSSLSAALIERLSQLSAPARQLSEALCLLDPTTVALERYPELVREDDRARLHQALDELISVGVLCRVGERCRFARPALPAQLERGLSADQKRVLHERIARMLERDPYDTRIARHWLLGGHELTAIEWLRTACRRSAVLDAKDLDVLKAAFEAAKRLGVSREVRLELHIFLLQAAAAAGRRDLFYEAGVDELIADCARDCGLLDCWDLPASWGNAMRAQEAQRLARMRYDATPENDRGLCPSTVFETVTRLYAAHNMMTSIGQEVALLERLPRLELLFDAHPRWRLTQQAVDVSQRLQEGRTTQAVQGATVLLATLNTLGDPTLEAGMWELARFSMLQLLAMFAATSGHERTGALVTELEQIPGYRGNAWRVRMVYELMRGNLPLAALYQRRAELLNLQDSGRTLLPGATVRIELLAHMYADNLLGVKYVMERIAAFAAYYPGWRPTLAIARCHYRRLQGDAQGALQELEPVLATQLGRHIDWWLIAYSHVKILCDLGRYDEGANAGERALKTWNDAQMSTVDYGLEQITAEALARARRYDDARRMIEHCIAVQQQLGTRGLRLGLAYETAARVAMLQGDETAVNHYTALCSNEYKGGRDLLLKAKLERLMQEAEASFATAVTPG